jgi:hypothetical protein
MSLLCLLACIAVKAPITCTLSRVPATAGCSFLAGALLRFQCVDDEEARGEAEVYASQSGEARIGGIAGTMALEQLPFLSSGRGWASAGE